MTPGDLVLKDPDALNDAAFDWTAYLGAATITTQSILITGTDALLVADTVTRDVTNKKVTYRLTGGTLGVRYTVTCRITTNETPAQTDDRSIDVLVQQR